jgi:hypothetical protein
MGIICEDLSYVAQTAEDHPVGLPEARAVPCPLKDKPTTLDLSEWRMRYLTEYVDSFVS